MHEIPKSAQRPPPERPGAKPSIEKPPVAPTSPSPAKLEVRDSFAQPQLQRSSPAPHMPREKSVFYEIGRSLTSDNQSVRSLSKLKEQLDAVNQSRGYIARFLDLFGSKEKTTYQQLKAHIERKTAELPESKLIAQLMVANRNNPKLVASELLKKATNANAEGNVADFNLAVRSLSVLAESSSRNVSDLALSALARVQKLPVMEAGSAPRTPTEVLVQMASEFQGVDASRLNPAQQAVLEDLQTRAKSAFMSHELNVEQMHELLGDFSTRLNQAGLFDLASRASSIRDQLPGSTKDLPLTRYQDNIYGRAYDSKLIGHLVKDPPEGVKEAMTQSGKLMADWLTDPTKIPSADLENAAVMMQKYLKETDPRFWFSQAPGLEKMRDAKSGRAATEALISFLRTPKESGVESIAVPYLTVKLSLIMRNLAQERAKKDAVKEGLQPNTEAYRQYVQSHAYDYTPWMSRADQNYEFVGPQANREGSMRPTEPGALAGITLQHQPAAVQEEWMTPSLRPATLNRPRIGEGETSDATKVALTQGLPFVSGVSGSTNIMLHYLDYMRKNTEQGKSIDPKNFLLGNTMFLVYDGGHSVHEALWIANQTEPKTGLGLGLGKGADPKAFVTNLNDFINANDAQTKAKLQDAANSAWSETTDYFKKHSVHSRMKTS